FAGGTFGTANGTGTNAQFVGPYGLALDPAGNLFVSDKNGGTDSSIRKISPAGVGTKINSLGTHDVGVDSQTKLYIADLFRNLVVRLTAAGASNNLFSATFPKSVAVDANSNVFFTAFQDHAIYKFVPGVGISVFAGSTNTSGFANGNGGAAR